MMSPPNHSLIEDLKSCLEKLQHSEATEIRDFTNDPIYSLNTHQGIYAITDSDNLEVVYIGKTNDGTIEKGVADRICGHCSKGSDLQIALGIIKEKFIKYFVRTIPIRDPARRGLVELYAIAVYGPIGNRYGHTGITTDFDERMPSQNCGRTIPIKTDDWFSHCQQLANELKSAKRISAFSAEKLLDMAGVYIFSDEPGKPIYIGEGQDIPTRLKRHFGKLRRDGSVMPIPLRSTPHRTAFARGHRWHWEHLRQQYVQVIEVPDPDMRHHIERALIREFFPVGNP